MMLLFFAVIMIVLLFGFVVLFGAPFLPTLKISTADALDLLDLRPGQVLLELGSGDGRIQRAAAQKGIHSVGYELNPLLVLWATIRNWPYRKFITTRWGNYWRIPLNEETDAIYVFLLDKYMVKLHKKIEQDTAAWKTRKRLKVVSFAFEIPDKKPIAQRGGMFLYRY